MGKDNKTPRSPAGDGSHRPPARERLIAAAARLSAAKGFDGVSVREICKEAGTGINMIHHYFGNKDGLHDAIAARFDESVYVVPLRLLEMPARSRDDLCARLELVIQTTLEACLAERATMMMALREQLQLATLTAFLDRLVKFLEEAQALGIVRAQVDTSMISGAILDRIINQVQFAPWIKASTGLDIAADAAYRGRWCRSNLDLFLHGLLDSQSGSGSA